LSIRDEEGRTGAGKEIQGARGWKIL